MPLTLHTRLTWALGAALLTGLAHAGGWQPPTRITSYVIDGRSDGDHIYITVERPTNPDVCPAPDAVHYRIYGNTRSGRLFYEAAVAAMNEGRSRVPNVQIWLSGCDELGRPVVKGVWRYVDQWIQ